MVAEEFDKAIADFTEAIRLNPNHGPAYCERGDTYAVKGDYDKAIADYNQALALNPNYAIGYNNRGVAWKDKGDYDKAIADFNQALAINPNHASACSNLGWLYATCPDEKYRDGQKAFANANKAYQLSGGKNWKHVDTLAAAYAECGDFDKAKEWQAKAIELAKTGKAATDKDKTEAAARLELYKQGKPYREEPKKK